VTFLFSDIEGSTRLVKALRERYARVLAEHRQLVRAAIAGHGGHEVDTQGDAFFAVFGQAEQAVLFWSRWWPRVAPTLRSPPSCRSACGRSAHAWAASATRPAAAAGPT